MYDYEVNAPWNQEDFDTVKVDVCVTTTLTKKTTVEVDDYAVNNCGDYDFSECDLRGAYNEDGYTITDLLKELKEYAKHDLENTSPNSGKGKHLKRLLAACEGWEVEDEEVEED